MNTTMKQTVTVGLAVAAMALVAFGTPTMLCGGKPRGSDHHREAPR